MYELVDGELGLSLGVYETEREALAAVRRICELSQGSRAPLGLVKDGQTVVASGSALVERAEKALSPA